MRMNFSSNSSWSPAGSRQTPGVYCLLLTRMRRNFSSNSSWTPAGSTVGALYHKL